MSPPHPPSSFCPILGTPLSPMVLGTPLSLVPICRCWERNEKAAVWWIIRCPILMAVAVGDMGVGG